METQNLEVDTLPGVYRGPCAGHSLLSSPLPLSSAHLRSWGDLETPGSGLPCRHLAFPETHGASYRLLPECSPNPLPPNSLQLHSKQHSMINGHAHYCLCFIPGTLGL